MSENLEKTDIEVLINVLEGRREFYLALAGFYFKPLTQDQIDVMAKTDYSEFGAGEPLLEAGFNDITRYLRKRHTGTRQMLAIDFTSSFGAAQTFKGRVAAPYASVFLSKEGLLSRQPRTDVYQIFKRNLLRVTEAGTPDDHLSFLLEFIAIMSDRIAIALQEDRKADACANLEESRNFINNFILSWFDDFAALANEFIKTRFYRGVLRITEGYLLMDLQTIDDMLEELTEE